MSFNQYGHTESFAGLCHCRKGPMVEVGLPLRNYRLNLEEVRLIVKTETLFENCSIGQLYVNAVGDTGAPHDLSTLAAEHGLTATRIARKGITPSDADPHAQMFYKADEIAAILMYETNRDADDYLVGYWLDHVDTKTRTNNRLYAKYFDIEEVPTPPRHIKELSHGLYVVYGKGEELIGEIRAIELPRIGCVYAGDRFFGAAFSYAYESDQLQHAPFKGDTVAETAAKITKAYGR